MVIFIFALLLRVYYITQKVGTQIDEPLTATITSCKYDYNLAYIPAVGHIYSGEELKELIIPKQKSIPNIISDLKQLKKNNCHDHAHPNLYYIMFKAFTVPAKKFDLPTLIQYGCGLNLIIFTLSYIVMYKLLKLLFEENQLMIPLGLIVAFLNTGVISTTLLVRMYELQIFCAIFITYSLARMYQSIIKNKTILSTKNIVLFIISSVMCILSGYFMGIYAGFILIVLILLLLFKKQYRTMLLLIPILLSISTITLLIYPEYFSGLSGSRGVQISHILIWHHFGNIINRSILGIISSYRFFLFYLPVVIILLISFFFIKKSKIKYLPLLLFFTAFLWTAIIMILSPEKILRYIVPVFPILSLIIPWEINCLTGIKKKVFSLSIILIYIFYSLTPKALEWYAFVSEPDGYKYYEKPIDLFSSHIENLYLNQPEFTNNPKIPVIFVVSGGWNYINLIYKLNDSQKYEFYYLSDKILKNDHNLYKKLNQILHKYNHYYLVQGYRLKETPDIKGFKNIKQNGSEIEYESPSIQREYFFELNKITLINYKKNYRNVKIKVNM